MKISTNDINNHDLIKYESIEKQLFNILKNIYKDISYEFKDNKVSFNINDINISISKEQDFINLELYPKWILNHLEYQSHVKKYSKYIILNPNVSLEAKISILSNYVSNVNNISKKYDFFKGQYDFFINLNEKEQSFESKIVGIIKELIGAKLLEYHFEGSRLIAQDDLSFLIINKNNIEEKCVKMIITNDGKIEKYNLGFWDRISVNDLFHLNINDENIAKQRLDELCLLKSKIKSLDLRQDPIIRELIKNKIILDGICNDLLQVK